MYKYKHKQMNNREQKNRWIPVDVPLQTFLTDFISILHNSQFSKKDQFLDNKTHTMLSITRWKKKTKNTSNKKKQK